MNLEDYNTYIRRSVGHVRLSEWGPTMEHSEPGQVGNQAALNCHFLVSEPTPPDIERGAGCAFSTRFAYFCSYTLNMSHRTGFTLLEIILVLVVLVTVASVGIPAVRGILVQQELKHAADTIRGEWLNTQITAREEGQILYMRARIGGSTIVIDRVLDAHFTAGLSSRQTTSRFDFGNEFDPFERSGFTGDAQDFVLRHPDDTTPGNDRIVIELPRSVTIADVITVADERAAFYLGLTTPDEFGVDEAYGIEALMTGEIRLGEIHSYDGTIWSTPIFFYPDGSTSTAAILLNNDAGRCIEVRLRGLTGSGSVSSIVMTTDYVGELNAQRF